jgi:hypothetical protein
MEPVFAGQSSEDHTRVTDVQGPTTIQDFHGMYWDNAEVIQLVRDALVAADEAPVQTG